MADGDAYFERLVDEDALATYLEAHLGPTEEFEVTHHPEGHSNETLFVTWSDRELVLRRPPPGETAASAHDVLREYRVMDALQETPVALPRTVLACEDHGVIGSDFYLMERLEGDVIREEEPARFATPEYRTRLAEEFVDTIAEIHTLDYDDLGLSEFGYPDGYTGRQVDTWTGQIDWATERTAEVRDVLVLREVGDWLDETVPHEYPHTLVHGDYKLDNVLFAPGTPPNLSGVFDWEMSTLGDPFVDLGWMLSYWPDPADPAESVELVPGTFLTHENYPTRRELLDRYEARTGLEFERERFYRAFGVYKAAAASEMFFRRYLEGNSDDPSYPLMEERVPALAERAMRIIEGEEPL